MKTFQQFLGELKNPVEIAKFKQDVAGVNTVDARSQAWAKTLRGYMEANGFKLLGKGKYAQVFGSDKYDYAIKVFLKDAAFLRWIAFVVKNQDNPFVPKTRGKVVKITPFIYALRMEKLQVSGSGGEFMKAYRQWQNDKNFVSENKHIQAILEEFGNNKKLLDLHGENLMYRNGHEVVVDPYYNWFRPEKSAFTIDPEEVDSSLF